jgi:hypothetical protein
MFKRNDAKAKASVQRLQARAAASAVLAATDKAAAKFAEEAELAQRVVTANADALQQRCEDADKYDSERAEIAARLDTATRTSFHLADRIERCRTLLDESLRAGRVEDASSHGTALGSMQLTAQRNAQLVEQLQQAHAAVPVSDVSDSGRAELPVLRKIAKSPATSHKYAVHKPDVNDEYRRLGEYVREHPSARVNTALPMRDLRHVV